MKYPEMSSPLSTMFVDILTQQDMMQRGRVDKEEVETKVEPVVTSSLLAPRDLSNRLSSEEMDRRMNEGAKRMGEDSVSLGKLLGMDKESTKKRVIKKAEKYLNNEISTFSSSIFSKWVKETKGIEAYKIKKEDKPEVVEEFLDFLNQ